MGHGKNKRRAGRVRGGAADGQLATLFAGAGLALGLIALARNRERLRPFLRAAFRELQGFKEWLLGEAERLGEELDDLSAEAARAQQEEARTEAQADERERRVMELLEQLAHKEVA